MSEEYIKYWGLTCHPFLLAPDGKMMCVTGQYFECFERLKYAINTNKGGVLIASEDPGLGKTTILMRLIEEMKEQYGKNFRYAFIDHPTLTASQMIEQITGAVTGQMPSEDKLRNLNLLKEALIETKREGGKNIIVIDEGQMLCEAREVLQEMRVLINLIHNNEYLHTFILSGQKTLWDTLQEIPEFWQRLPVRYYFTPLRFEETRELIRYRLNKAGLDVARDIFTDEALEIIHKYSQGLPRTIIALSDLALLNGFTDRVRKVGFKEVSKAINAMGGKGDSLSYVTTDRREEREMPTQIPVEPRRPVLAQPTKPYELIAENVRKNLTEGRSRPYVRNALAVTAVLICIFLGAAGYRFFSSTRTVAVPPVVAVEPAKVNTGTATAAAAQPQPAQQETTPAKTETSSAEISSVTEDSAGEPKVEKDVIAAYKEERSLGKDSKKPKTDGVSAIVDKDSANVRTGPSIAAPRILTIVKGEMLSIIDQRKDKDGMIWHKVLLYNNRIGWIADKVVTTTGTRQ